MPADARPGGRFWSLAVLAGALCGAALAAPKPAAEPPSKEERAGLTLLHRHAVKLFIDRDGFGFSRLEPPLADVLAPPKSQAEVATDRRPTVPNTAAVRPDTGAKGAHFSFAKAVGAAAFFPHRAGEKTWVVKEVQLVGLVKHKNPVVYLGGPTPGRAGERTRRPDEFEAKALEVIRGGGDPTQAEKRGGTLRAVSGIYAGRRCAKCHERPGEMLGAFSYRLALEEAPAKKAVGAGLPRP
jgi:hypothetical protein